MTHFGLNFEIVGHLGFGLAIELLGELLIDLKFTEARQISFLHLKFLFGISLLLFIKIIFSYLLDSIVLRNRCLIIARDLRSLNERTVVGCEVLCDRNLSPSSLTPSSGQMIAECC